MTEVKNQNRYSDNQLLEFKAIIEEKIEKAQEQIQLFRGLDRNANSGDEMGKAHNPFEQSSEDASRQLNENLAIKQEKFVRDLKNALLRIGNKTYGICRITGQRIPKQRLLLVPHATLSVEGKQIEQQRMGRC